MVSWSVPDAIGLWATTVKPIPVAASLRPIAGEDKPGGFGVVAVLFDQGSHLPNHAVEAGHRALNSGVEKAINTLLRSLGIDHQSITQDDINSVMGNVSQQVHDAIVNDLSPLEQLWALTEADEQIGQQLWHWDQDLLTTPTGQLPFTSASWPYVGDWTLSGKLTWGLTSMETDVAPAVATVPDGVVFFAKSLDGRIYSNRVVLGQAGQGWVEVEGGGRTDAAPAAAAAGNAPYMFVAVKDLDGYVSINQGDVGHPYVGWARG
jgi:hypothetical protein